MAANVKASLGKRLSNILEDAAKEGDEVSEILDIRGPFAEFKEDQSLMSIRLINRLINMECLIIIAKQEDTTHAYKLSSIVCDMSKRRLRRPPITLTGSLKEVLNGATLIYEKRLNEGFLITQ